MQQFEVGSPFPRTLPPGYGMFIQPVKNGAFDAVIRLQSPRTTETDGFRRGTFRYGLFVEGTIPIFLLDFSDAKMELDAPCIFRTRNDDELNEWVAGDGNAITMYLIDERNIIRAMRLIGVEVEMMKLLRETVALQLTYSITELQTAMDRIFLKNSTNDLLKRTKLYTIIR